MRTRTDSSDLLSRASPLKASRCGVLDRTGSQLFSGFFLDEGAGGVMPVPPLQRYMAGELNVAALVVGSNTKDGTAQFYTWPGDGAPVVPEWSANATQYAAAVTRQYGPEVAGSVLAQYPLGRFGGFASSAFLQVPRTAT